MAKSPRAMSERSKETESPKQSAHYSAPALDKGLDIIELLSSSGRGLTQTEICSKLGRNINEIYRMLNCLVRRNYVANVGDSYRITTQIYELAHLHPPTERLVQEATVIMQDLVDRIDQSCHVTIYGPGKQVVVAKAEAAAGLAFSIRLGSEVDVPLSASGLVLLAFQERATRQMRLDECTKGMAHPDRQKIERLLNEVSQKGFASIESSQFRGLHVVSFPVYNSQGSALAAITVPYLDRLDRDDAQSLARVQSELSIASRALTKSLGGKCRLPSY